MSSKRKAMASNSFTKEQVQILTFLVDTLLRGGDARMAVRHKAFNGLVAKVHRMRDKIRQQERNGQGGDNGEDKQGSGGDS